MFDTHLQHESLLQAGFSGTQARALTSMATAVLDVVATKADLERLNERLEARFDAVDKRFEDFNKSLDRLNFLMIGQIGATIGGMGIIVGS
ncbi:MAG: hypothetical protein JOY59_00855, partial [Candidatus Eremiobacteraeota bacterium]|nr:hypothetical protein [Candidatus Eremiobacteraeota bacterium]